MDCQDLSLVEALLAEGQRAIVVQHFDDAIPPLSRGLDARIALFKRKRPLPLSPYQR